MNIKLLLSISFIFLSCFSIAQYSENCATPHVYSEHIKNQQVKQNYQATELAARNWLNNPINKSSALAKNQNTIITIPVVVHVVYKNAVQNIPDTQIVRQIQILNECFRLQNPNYSSIRSIFDTIGADIEIQFCLANIDPSGNPTTGIIRKSAPSNAAFDPIFNYDKVKSSTTNGDDAWPHDKYLNIWVCDMSFFGTAFVLGYATFPGGPANLDGVVIQSEYFGFGTAAAPNNLGRTTVHEVGHWFGMRHIWADDDGQGSTATTQCDSTDFVDDTPNAAAKSQSDCNLTINSCSNESSYWGTIDPPDMVENYMDYSADACMALFTKGQKARMYSFLNTDPARSAIRTSPAGCSTTGIKQILNNFSAFVNVFPNPSTDFINVHISQYPVADLKCDIYNNHGQLVKQLNNLDFRNSIDVSELSNGIYVLKIYNSEVSASKKITICK